MKLSLVVLLITSLTAKMAFACNDLTVATNPVNLNTNGTQTINFSVIKNVTTQCDFFVDLTKGTSNDGSYNRYLELPIYTTNRIPISILKPTSNQSLYAFADAPSQANNLIGGTIRNNTPNTTTLSFKEVLGTVPSNTRAGTYTNTWQLGLYTSPRNSNTYTLRKQVAIQANYTVPVDLSLSVTAIGGSYNVSQTSQTLNFGTLAQSALAQASIWVKSNTPFQLSLSSANGGALKQTGAGSDVNKRVLYQFGFGSNAYTGTVSSISFPYTSSSILPPFNTAIQIPVNVTINESTSGKLAGTYLDTVTLTLTAN